MSKWFKKNDKVVVVSGNDKGKTGVILYLKGDYVVVQGVNIRKKHQKRRSQMQTSTIVEVECPIHRSNVSFADETGNKVKVKVRVKDGSKQLYYKSGQEEVALREVRKIG